MKTMVEYINHRALELCMKSGMRFMECKKFVMDVAGESRCIGSRDSTIHELDGIIEEAVQFETDYREYDQKMREAGLK